MIKRITTSSGSTIEIESSFSGVRLRRLGGVRMRETSLGAAAELERWRDVRTINSPKVGHGILATFEDNTFYASTPIVKIEEVSA